MKGWFNETFKNPPFEKLSLLRLDGDMYASTWDSLIYLYDKVASGGFIIVDDYFLLPCRNAVNDFRKLKNITEPIIEIDSESVYWKKGNFDGNNNNSCF